MSSSSSDTEHFLSFSTSEDSLSNGHSFCSIPTLSQTLESQFSDGSRNFNVVHFNAQSIPAHYPDMLASFDHKTIHAVLVSESWLKPCLPTTSYSLPGFVLIRNDRTDGRGGGVAIYLRAHIPHTVVHMSPQPPSAGAGEHLFVEILLRRTKILLGVYYSKNSQNNFFPSFERLLEDLTPSYCHTIIMGDFNTCLLKQDSRSTSLENLAQASNLTILPLTATHFFPHCNPSLLDLILVSSPNNVSNHGQTSAPAFSYHDLIFLSYKVRPPKAKPKTIQQRNFGRMNLEKLREDAQKIDWSELMSESGVDGMVDCLTNQLIKLYDLHAPMRPVKLKHLPAPWLTDEIRSAMHKKDIAKVRLMCKSTDTNKAKYHERRNHCNRLCRDAQRRFIHNSVDNVDPSKVWKFLRTLGVGKSKQENISRNIDINLLNKHFSNSSTVDSFTKLNTLNYLSSLPTPDISSFHLSKFADCDVKKSIASITSSAVGSDSISRNMIVPILNEIVPVITYILNASIVSGTFPVAWKEAQIVPLPKKPNPTAHSEYRPISILPYLSKVLERLVHQQLSSFLYRNSLLNPLQSGFRPGHSTTTALVKITDDIRFGMDSGKVTILSLLDFSSAFNNVDFDLLLGVLCSLNISPTAINWFRSYLFGRRQRIRLEDAYSSWCNLSAGVPQGGVLSPLLFAIFIHSVTQNLVSSYHLYADDLQIYYQTTTDNVSGAVSLLNTDLDRVCNWSNSFGLTVNPSKTQVIVVGSSKQLSKIDFTQLPSIVFNGTAIPISRTVKNLGIIIDSKLSWEPWIGEVSRKMFASSASLRRLRNFLPTATKVMLAQSLLLPILDYADASYLDLSEVLLNKLERLQNLCIRFIFGLRKYDHVSEFRTKLKWLPIRFRRNAHILSLLYNILFHSSSPPYLKERFEFLHQANDRNLRSTDTLQLITPVHSSVMYGKSFTVKAVKLWYNCVW